MHLEEKRADFKPAARTSVQINVDPVWCCRTRQQFNVSVNKTRPKNRNTDVFFSPEAWTVPDCFHISGVHSDFLFSLYLNRLCPLLTEEAPHKESTFSEWKQSISGRWEDVGQRVAAIPHLSLCSARRVSIQRPLASSTYVCKQLGENKNHNLDRWRSTTGWTLLFCWLIVQLTPPRCDRKRK